MSAPRPHELLCTHVPSSHPLLVPLGPSAPCCKPWGNASYVPVLLLWLWLWLEGSALREGPWGSCGQGRG